MQTCQAKMPGQKTLSNMGAGTYNRVEESYWYK